MNGKSDFFRTLSAYISVVVITSGFLVMLGWWLDIGVFKSVFPGLVAMKFNAAIMFVLTGISLWSIQFNKTGKTFSWLARACSLITALIGALTFFEYLTGVNMGIDQLLVIEMPDAILTTHPGRIAITTAISFVLLNISLLMINSKKEHNIYVVQGMAVIVGFLSYQALIGYVFGVKILFILHKDFTAMALHTSVLFFFLASGVIFSRPDRGLMRIVCSDSPGGMMLYKMLPITLILPPLFGWLKMIADRMGIISDELGVSLVALCNTIVFTILLWLSARSVFRTEEQRKETEEELKSSEKRYRTIFQSAANGILIAGIENKKFIYANPAICKMLDYPEAELIKLSIQDIHPKDSLDFVFTEFEAHARREKTLAQNIPCLRRDGSIIYVNINTTMVAIDGIKCNIGFFTDITARKQTEEALRKRELELNESQRLVHIGSWDWDAITDTIQWSPEYYRIYNIDPELPTPNYKEHLKIYTPDSAERLNAVVERAMQIGEPYEIELELVNPGESRRWIFARGEAKRGANGKIVGLRGTAQNITERKKAEEALKQAKDELEKQNIELKKLDVMKDNLIRDMTHELKTPVAKHLMELELLKRFLKKHDLLEESKNILNTMESSIRRQEHVINNILDLSRLEAGVKKYNIKEIRLDQVVEDVLKDYESILEKNEIKVEKIMEALPLYSDSQMLFHVFSNLINNSIKYSNSTKEKFIKIVSEKYNDKIIIKVIDNGIGLTEECKQRAFDKFYQASASSEGTGVGLTITKMIIEELGGRIWLESDGNNKGTTAIVELPICQK